MIGDGGQPAHWLLATQMSADGNGIVANDPAIGKQFMLNYNASTKTVGGITGEFDADSHKFALDLRGGYRNAKPVSLAGLHVVGVHCGRGEIAPRQLN